MESASVAFSEWIDSSSCPLEQSGRWFQLSGGWPDRRYDPQARWSGSQSRLEQHRVFYRYVRMPLIREDDSEDSSDEDVPGYALGYMRVDVTQMRECFQPGAVRCGKCSVVLTPSDTEWPEPALPHAMPELKTEIPYDQTNTSISDACKHCCHKVTPAVARKLWAELEQSHQGKSKRRVVGCVSSDMSAMDDWCGQQKSGCTHYCFGCAALKKDRLSYKQSGSIHSPHTLYKYQLHDCRKQEVKQPMHRTFEKMTQQAVEYAAEYQKYEAELAKAKESEAHQKATTGKKQKVTMPKPPEGKSPQFQNIIHRPLKSTGKVIHVVGSMALHICLGVRKLAYDMFEAEIRKLDNELKGWGVEGLASLSKLQDKLYTANAAVEDSRLEYEATLPAQESHLEAEIKEMESLEDDGDGWALRKNKGPKSKYKESCDDAKEIQEKYAALKSQLASVVAAINNSRDEMHENEKKVKAIRAELNQHDGPLMVDVRELLSELRLERQVYHSGAFNGNDLDKLYAVDVIHQLSSILAPRRVRKVFCVNGTTFEASILFGSFEMAQKYCTLFHKLRQLKTLYRATRPLCKHEVAQLRARAISLGNWFPVNFPHASITPKFHWLTYHIPEIAEALGSAGQSTEQVIESVHASMNLYNRNYASIQNTCKRYTAQAKNQWARSWQGRGSVRSFVSKARSKRMQSKTTKKAKDVLLSKHDIIKALRSHRRLMRACCMKMEWTQLRKLSE